MSKLLNNIFDYIYQHAVWKDNSGNVAIPGNLTIGAKPVNDFIIEEYLSDGAAGNWSWRKWSSGIFECWASHTVTLTADTTSGSLYYSKPVYVHLPKLKGTTYVATGAVVEITSGNQMAWAVNAGMTSGTPTGTPSDSNTAGTILWRAMRGVAMPASGNFRIYTICRWSTVKIKFNKGSDLSESNYKTDYY